MPPILIPYERLSNEQKSTIGDIVRLDTNLNVSGPPGSGKTLISLFLVKSLLDKDAKKRILVVMFNHSLYGYLRTAFKELGVSDNITIQTKDKLFWDLGRGHSIDIASNGTYEQKYKSILSQLDRVRLNLNYDYIIVDEVQDLQQAEWDLLNRMTKRIISLGDFNQGVYKTDLSPKSVLSRSKSYKLNRIFRFPSSIAKIAERFVDKINREEVIDRIAETWPVRIEVKKQDEFAELLRLLQELNTRQESKAVICPDRRQIKQLSAFLKEQGLNHHFYDNNKELRNHDFTSYTPTLITSHSSKGLEFDNVILFGFNTDAFFGEMNLNQILYVSITRTNNKLYLIQNESTIPELVNLEFESENDEEIDDFLDF